MDGPRLSRTGIKPEGLYVIARTLYNKIAKKNEKKVSEQCSNFEKKERVKMTRPVLLVLNLTFFSSSLDGMSGTSQIWLLFFTFICNIVFVSYAACANKKWATSEYAASLHNQQHVYIQIDIPGGDTTRWPDDMVLLLNTRRVPFLWMPIGFWFVCFDFEALVPIKNQLINLREFFPYFDVSCLLSKVLHNRLYFATTSVPV
jgi:hypothetical protein